MRPNEPRRTFRVCDPKQDPNYWMEIEIAPAYDLETQIGYAAEKYAEDDCHSDPESYSRWLEDGTVELIVEDHEKKQWTLTVYAEATVSFWAGKIELVEDKES